MAWIVLPPAVDVGAGVEWVLEDLLERRPVRTAPDQLPLARSLPHPDPDLDLMPRQVAQDAGKRPQLGELLEDQTDNRSDLLVRIERDLAVVSDVARRQREAQLAAPRLAQPPLVHPLLQHVQLRFAQCALQP